MDESWRTYEDETLRLSHPSEWRVLTQMRGCRLMLLTPAGSSDFRSSMTITEEPRSDESLDVILETLLPTIDRYLTDYAPAEVEDVQVGSLPAKLVRGIYRQGRLRVALDQWMVPTHERLFAISASYDHELDRHFFDLASGVVASLEFVSVH